MAMLLLFVVTSVMLVGGLVLIGESYRFSPLYPTCRGCGGDLTELLPPGVRCPECGGQYGLGGIAGAPAWRGDGCCGQCGYPVTGGPVAELRCPVCDRPFSRAGVRPPRSGSIEPAMLLVGVLLTLASPVMCMVGGSLAAMMP